MLFQEADEEDSEGDEDNEMVTNINFRFQNIDYIDYSSFLTLMKDENDYFLIYVAIRPVCCTVKIV